jgi:hypothetical protein
MPITQYRMIALLDAAEDYRQALEKLISEIKREAGLVIGEGKNPAEALGTVILLADPVGLLTHKYESLKTMAQERAHYDQGTIRRNDRERIKQSKRRGIEPGATRLQTPQYPRADEARSSAPDAVSVPARILGSPIEIAEQVKQRTDAPVSDLGMAIMRQARGKEEKLLPPDEYAGIGSRRPDPVPMPVAIPTPTFILDDDGPGPDEDLDALLSPGANPGG